MDWFASMLGDLNLKASGNIRGVDVSVDTTGGSSGGHSSGARTGIPDAPTPGLIAGVSSTMVIAAVGLYFLAKN